MAANDASASPQPSTEVGDQLAGRLVALLSGSSHHRAGDQRRVAVCHLEQPLCEDRVFICQRPRLAHQGPATRILLDTAPVAASAQMPVRDHPHMAELGSDAVRTPMEPAVHDDTAADAGADGHADHVVDDVLGGAEPELSPRGGVGIVLHHGRQPGRGRHLVTDRHVPPGEVRREQHRRPPDVDESGRADADRLDVATAAELVDHSDDVVDDRGWIRRRRVASGTCENHAGLVDQSAGDLRPTDVDADRVAHAALLSPLRAS